MESQIEMVELLLEPDLVDFVEDVKRMQRLYRNAKHSQAEALRNKLAEQLDDLMRL